MTTTAALQPLQVPPLADDSHELVVPVLGKFSTKKKEFMLFKTTYWTGIHTNVVSVPGKRVAKLIACAL